MNKKNIAYFILILYTVGFFISMPLNENIVATSVYASFGFEGCVAGNPITTGNPVGSGNIITSKQVGTSGVNFAVSSSTKRSGTLGFRMKNNNPGWFNFTYGATSYLTTFSFYWYIDNSNNHVITFYNNTLGRYSGCLINFSWVYSSRYLYYANELGTYVLLDNVYNLANWGNLCKFTIDSPTGTVLYQTNDVSLEGVARHPNLINSGYRIDRIYWSIGGSSGDYSQIDDMNWTVSDSYGTGGGGGITETYCGIDVSTYATQIGDIYGIGSYNELKTSKVSSNYAIPLSTTIYGVGLTVGVEQFADDNNVSNYFLEVNGINMSNPLCFTTVTSYYGTHYVLYWDIALTLDNETATFTFIHNKVNVYGVYWRVGQATYTNEDLDNDGDSIYYYSQSSTTWSWTWILFGGIYIPFYLPTTSTITQINFDLGMSFWSGQVAPIPPPVVYNNTLGLNSNIQNETGYLYYFPDLLTNGIVLSYTLADQLNDYYIFINYSFGGNYEEPYYIGEFNSKSVAYPDGTLSMIPIDEGRYTFTLYRGTTLVNPVANITAWVIGNLSTIDYYIYTNPPITWQFDTYDVIYKYFNPSGYDGFVAYFKDYFLYTEHGFDSKDTGWDIPNNINGSNNYQSDNNNPDYWGLYANKSYAYVLTVPLHKHLIRLYGILENKIWVLPTSLKINAGNPENRQVVIYYQHRFLGSDVSIYLNNQWFANVGDYQAGSVAYKPLQAGHYVVKLILNQNGSDISIATPSSFDVSMDGVTPPPPNPFLLDAPFSYIAGAIITVLFTILPVYFIGKINIQSDIVKYVPVFTGMIGFILCCLVGFFPWYAIFGLVLILVLVIVVMWQSNKS